MTTPPMAHHTRVVELLRQDLSKLDDQLIGIFEKRNDDAGEGAYTTILTEEEELFENVASGHEKNRRKKTRFLNNHNNQPRKRLRNEGNKHS